MLDPSTRDAVLRAADFFAANPTARTHTVLARAKSGEPVSPSSPIACAWCGLGRIAKELGLGFDNIDLFQTDVYHTLSALGLSITTIWAANDIQYGCSSRTPEFVDFLREGIARA